MASTRVHAPRTGESRAWLLVPALAMALQAAVLIAVGQPAGSWANDQDQYHLVTIERFALELPWPNIVDYPSATSPGWHLVLAVLLKAGVPLVALRALSALVGVTLVLAATIVGHRWASPRVAALLTLPLALSPYAVGGSAWITTDVPALACMALSLAAVLQGLESTLRARTGGREDDRRWSPWLATIAATAGVAIRQPLVWLAAPIALRGLRERRPGAIALAFVPVILLTALVLIWGGLIPPAYRSLHQRGANPAGLAVLLALIGAWGGPLALALLVADDARGRVLRSAAVGAVLAAAITLCFATSYAKGEGGIEGRWGGPIWSAVQHTPAFADRSVLLTALAAAGGATIAVLWNQAVRRGTTQAAGLVLLALACVAAANAANSQAWQRYADLPLLLLVPWLAALGTRSARAATAVCVASCAVAAMQAGIAAVNLWKPALFASAPGATP